MSKIAAIITDHDGTHSGGSAEYTSPFVLPLGDSIWPPQLAGTGEIFSYGKRRASQLAAGSERISAAMAPRARTEWPRAPGRGHGAFAVVA
jgi:hypothetical protein